MEWRQAMEAFKDAENTLSKADQISDDMAKLLIGRLRNVRSYRTLERLKKELTQYNAKTGEWKN